MSFRTFAVWKCSFLIFSEISVIKHCGQSLIAYENTWKNVNHWLVLTFVRIHSMRYAPRSYTTFSHICPAWTSSKFQYKHSKYPEFVLKAEAKKKERKTHQKNFTSNQLFWGDVSWFSNSLLYNLKKSIHVKKYIFLCFTGDWCQ